jgi:hypothetical protein
MQDETGGERPRAFYPEFAQTYDEPGRTPGWDLDGPERRMGDGRTLARTMGWLSFGLGAVELAAPGKVADFLGVDRRHTKLIRGYGAREVASGVGIMAQRTPAAGAWSRVAGDALDLATLAVALAPSRRRKRVLLAMGVVAGALALDALAAKKLTHRKTDEDYDRGSRRPRTFRHEGATYHDVRPGSVQRSDRMVRLQREGGYTGGES